MTNQSWKDEEYQKRVSADINKSSDTNHPNLNMFGQIQAAFQLLATDPEQAAQNLERVANALLRHAKRIRGFNQDNPFQSEAGFSNKVTMSVVGPDGAIKATTTVVG